MAVTVEPEDIKRIMRQALVDHAKDRRERIATAVLGHLLGVSIEGSLAYGTFEAAASAVAAADALIAELDK